MKTLNRTLLKKAFIRIDKNFQEKNLYKIPSFILSLETFSTKIDLKLSEPPMSTLCSFHFFDLYCVFSSFRLDLNLLLDSPDFIC